MKNIYLSLLILIITATMAAQTDINENISCAEASELIQQHADDSNFIILDVRTPEEFNYGHIEKAILVDFHSGIFKDRIALLDRNKIYLIYCKRGGRSAEAIKIMKELEFKNLYHLYEGFLVWDEKGFKKEK